MKIEELTEAQVSSSWLKDVTFTNGNAAMTLRNGQVYEIFDITEETYNQWMSAPSIGAFYNKNIKDAYKVNRVS